MPSGSRSQASHINTFRERRTPPCRRSHRFGPSHWSPRYRQRRGPPFGFGAENLSLATARNAATTSAPTAPAIGVPNAGRLFPPLLPPPHDDRVVLAAEAEAVGHGDFQG